MAHRFINAHLVREELERRLNREVDPDIWADLVEHGDVRDVTDAGVPISQLLGWYTKKENRYGRNPPVVPGARIERGQDAETELLSKLVAAEAAEDPGVVGFRSAVLGRQLLKWGEVPAWLEGVADAEGPPGGYFTGVRYPGDVLIEHQTTGERIGPYPTTPICVSETNPTEGTRRVALAFAKEGDVGESRMIVEPGGVLAQLNRLSEHLADVYNWQPAQATAFVLTGIAPTYSRAAVTFHYVGTREKLIPRLTFTLDPSLPANEVLNIYRSARRELMAPLGGPRRRRPVEEKSLGLADFAAAMPEGTWEARMGVWNRQHGSAHPEWVYDNRRNFQRDIGRVLERMARHGVRSSKKGNGRTSNE